MKRLLGASVLAMALLPACSTLESLQQEVFAPTPATESEPDPGAAGGPAVEVENPPPAPGRKPEVAASPAPQTAVAVPQKGRLEPASEPNPRLLVGLDFDAIKALLGDPALQSEQPPAKVWAYNAGDCMFNVFFYPSVEDNVFRVLTYAATGMVNSQTASTASTASAPVPTTETSTAPAATLDTKDNAVVRRCFVKLLDNRDAPSPG